ncbi:hypothetical protein MMYC01_200516 [Madurella mycetomatis]|uniref:Uncharacterized protein n=1 Tax=Madurella mycetomatis TaxID=100816 RepID=A0A175WHT0_9PEZI|nr:hypothetical protein MMYC01_200516 [Madurella mycetomatis]
MPGLTIATDARPDPAPTRRTSTSTSTNPRRTSSPPRPPVSPITPTLGPSQLPATGGPGPTFAPTRQPNDNSNSSSNSNNHGIPDFALGRPAFTHTQPDQVAIAPPPAQPINFDENPDVIALKSAISILQLQRARATADIQALNRAKTAALADPSAFIADLAAGRVGTEGDPLFLETDDSDGDDEEEGGEEEHAGQEPTSAPGTGAKTDGGTDNDTPMTDGGVGVPPKKREGKQNNSGSSSSNGPAAGGEGGTANTATAPAAWRKLPKPQNVVRCPPINWAQYGVVGESLDKLHAEQVAAPTPGAPVALGPGGTYEFKAGSDQAAAAAGEQQPRRLVGIAAPYTPGKDKLEKKGKGGKR